MRRGLCTFSITSLFGALLAATPSAARAQTSGSAAYGASPREVSLSVNVTASVSAACSFSSGAVPSGTYSVGNVEGAYSLDVAFSLRCNSPSRVGIVSDNGGMKANVPTVPNGYSQLAPYQITLSLAGNATTASATCQSGTLTAGTSGCVFRGPATASAGLRLPGASDNAPGSFIRISSQGYTDPAILIASNSYADRLTVTISPAT